MDRRYFSHLNSAVEILGLYDGKLPFHHFIREFLKLNKKYGSKDRKNISRLCYAALRIGKAFPAWHAENRIRAGLFLCNDAIDAVTEQLIGDYNEVISKTPAEKWKIVCSAYASEYLQPGSEDIPVSSIFPAPTSSFSVDLQNDAFLFSFFNQPDLFLRIRPGKKAMVEDKLSANGIQYELLPPSAVRLPINTKLEELFEVDKEVVVQDYSSQLTALPLSKITTGVRYAWDACAASGGKSLLAADTLGNIRLTVTDIRASIIFNLEKRFQQAGIRNYHAYIVDLSGNAPLPFDQQQDLVIADVPCSGSGTWSRTPEQLTFFEHLKVGYYQDLQQRILGRIVPVIRPGGYLLYITCSVFHQENEDNVSFLKENLDLEIIEQKLIIGYPSGADTLFAALLKKPG